MKDIAKDEQKNLDHVNQQIDEEIEESNKYLATANESMVIYDGISSESNLRYRPARDDKKRYESLINDLEKLKKNPYFQRMDFLYIDSKSGKKSIRRVMLGLQDYFHNHEHIIYDWRSDYGDFFKLSSAKYHQNRVTHEEEEVVLKREVYINDGVVLRAKDLYDDSGISEDIVDPFLLDVLINKRNSPNISNIVSTIQKDQNEIIRSPLNESFLVKGCAGSGKTMVMFHRVSYITYQKPNLRTGIYVVVPNELFLAQITPLLQEIKISDIKVLTLRDLFREIMTQSGIDLQLPTVGFSPKEFINDKIIDYIYSNEFVQRFQQSYQKRFETFFDSSQIERLNHIIEKLEGSTLFDEKINESNLDDYLELLVSIKLNTLDRNSKFHENQLQIASLREDLKSLKSLQEQNELEIKAAIDGINTILNQISKASFQSFGFDYNSDLEEIISLYSSVHSGNYDNAYVRAKRLYEQVAGLTLFKSHQWPDFSVLSILIQTENQNTGKSEGAQIEIRRTFYEIIARLGSHFEKDQKKWSSLFAENPSLDQIRKFIKDSYNSKVFNHDFDSALEIFISLYSEVYLSNFENAFDSAKKLYDHVSVIPLFKSLQWPDFSRLSVMIRAESKSEVKSKSTQKEIKNTLIQIVCRLGFLFVRDLKRWNNLLVEIPAPIEVREFILDSYTSKSYSQSIKSVGVELNKRLEIERNSISKVASQDDLKEIDKWIEMASHIKGHHPTIHKHILEETFIDFSSSQVSILRSKPTRANLYTQVLYAKIVKGINLPRVKCLCFDEAQDVSLQEYQLIKDAIPDGTPVSLFGDINQSIFGKQGLDDWEGVIELFNLKQYEINFNYRNTYEITEFTNRCFGMSTGSIALNGPVVEIIKTRDFKGRVMNLLSQLGSSRVAIIVNDITSEFGTWTITQLEQHINRININRYSPGYLSILDISYSKGLEFETVIVVDRGLSLREKYVAYTRALNALLVVSEE